MDNSEQLNKSVYDFKNRLSFLNDASPCHIHAVFKDDNVAETILELRRSRMFSSMAHVDDIRRLGRDVTAVQYARMSRIMMTMALPIPCTTEMTVHANR